MRIVVIDDSSVFRERVTRHLAQDPAMQVVGHAADGEEALRVIDEARPDVVLLDIYMPVADGFAVLRHMNDRPTDTKVIVLTSNLSPVVQERCATLRADAVIDKADTGLKLLPTLKMWQTAGELS
jgi:DNA-binding NarL/FixJ family response regulator